MKLFRIFLMIIALHCACGVANGQELLGDKERDNAVKEIISDYKNWNAAAWQAGVKTSILPITPTMKVYMKKGELTLISLRVPLLGEVGRIEIDNENVLVINKMKKRYWEKSIAEVDSIIPDAQQTLQALLLGRVAVFGYGELSKKNGSYTQIYSLGSEGWLILPELPDNMEGGAYGYAVNSDGEITDVILASTDDDSTSKLKDLSVSVNVTYGKNGDADASLSMKYGTTNIEATIDADTIEWGAKGFDRFQLTSAYKKSSFKECLKF